MPGRPTFSRDGRLLVIGQLGGENGNFHSVAVWDMSKKKIAYTLPSVHEDSAIGFQNTLTGIDFSPDGKILAVGDWMGPLRIWNGRTGQPITNFRPHKGYVQSVCFSPDGKTLATAGSDEDVKLWNVATWREVARFKVSHPRDVAFSSDGTLLFCTGSRGVHLWKAPSVSNIEARRRLEASSR